jgi:hypothetical protein
MATARIRMALPGTGAETAMEVEMEMAAANADAT